jgi:hypothetical protein
MWRVCLLLCADELRSSESLPLEGSQGLLFIDQEKSLGVHDQSRRRRGREERERLQEKEFPLGVVSSYWWAPLAHPLMTGMALHVVVSMLSSASHGASSVKPWHPVQPWQTLWLAVPSTVS